MDPEKIRMLVATHAGVEADVDEEVHLVIATVIATINGRTVRVEVTDAGESGPYRYNATARDGETGEFLATGNGAASLDEALSIVHWRKIRSAE